MVRLPHQREEDAVSDTPDGDEDSAEGDEDDPDDPIEAIFRIIERYYEGIAKREDEGMGVG